MRFTVLLVGALLLPASTAYAYLDPGTGSAILQGVLGALAAISITLKLYWHRLLRFFRLGRAPGTPEEPEVSAETAKHPSD